MTRHIDRRDFLKNTAAASAAIAGAGVWSQLPAAESKSPNEKLDIVCIGTSNQARFSIGNVQRENIVAMCDIDDNYLNRAKGQFPKAKMYNDFRKLFDKEKGADAAVVATPDHIHAPASAMAMRLGMHCYCEKPLTHTVHEARVLAELSIENRLATQLGTQIHAGGNYRRVVEAIQAGAVGAVREVHVWVGKGWGGGDRPAEGDPVPKNLHWDLWLGPAPERPYAKGRYHPANWRRWWDFGGGTLGDMACHYMDLPFWALKLRHPTSVSAEGPKVHPETCPLGMIVHYEFPARGDMPACKFTWSDGNKIPRSVAGHRVPGSGVMFVGDKGEMFANYGGFKVYLKDPSVKFTPPKQTIANSIGHHAEWIKACKDGSSTTCNFDYSGALTEAVLLGNVAFRTGKKLEWDAKNLKATNCPEADQFLKREYRKGWTL